MSDYLTRLVGLTLGLAPTVRPRTFPPPILPDQRVVDAGVGRPAHREAGLLDTWRGSAFPRDPDGAVNGTSPAGSATPPRPDVRYARPPRSAAPPGHGFSSGERPAGQGASTRAETPPEGGEPAPPRTVHRKAVGRPSEPAPATAPTDSGPRQAGKQPPGEIRVGGTSSASERETAGETALSETRPTSDLLTPAHREVPLHEHPASSRRATTPVETRTIPGPSGETRPRTRDVPVRNHGDEAGPVRSGHAPPKDTTPPERGPSSGAATFGAPDERRPPASLPETPDRVGLDPLGGLTGAPPTVRITIGRVEARAVPPAAPTTGASGEKRGPALSLNDYLRLRGRRA